MNIFQLESLPNEIFNDIFQFLQSSHLFRAFYNLNLRFNNLLETFPYLTLNISTHRYTEDDSFPFIRTLIIHRAINVDLNHFLHIHSLILRYPTENLLSQFNYLTFQHLKYLSINHMHISVFNYIPNLCKQTFSNAFPKLKSCQLFKWGTIIKNSQWTLSPTLRIVKVGKIDLIIYKSILTSCPNLSSLQLATLTSNNTLMSIVPHRNLKQLIIRTSPFLQPWKDNDIDCCLSYVPELEYFSVHQTDMFFKQKYNWLASIISTHLIFLQQFDFYFHICDIARNETFTLDEIEENFYITHHNRYQSRFIVVRTKLF
ncbi:hypothetical protein I4U23_001519 [Adineta vaga]|nr:hypothetical protein I4U23_001519 [Adineta vaga]